MDQNWGLEDGQWLEIDGAILGCRQSDAYWRVREMIATEAEEAKHIVLQRYHFLRAKRQGDFAWKAFDCDDYIASNWAEDGCWSDPFTRIIAPASLVYVREDLDFLVVGGPGFDGIIWGYRKGHPGIWEYIPMEAEFGPLARTIEELILEKC